VSFNLGDGSSSLALYQWEAAAHDAGVSPEGSGFRGVSFHFIVSSREAVDEVMRPAVVAGGSVVKEAAASPFGTSGTSAIQTATSERSPLAPEHPAALPRTRHAWHGEWDAPCRPPPQRITRNQHGARQLPRRPAPPARRIPFALIRSARSRRIPAMVAGACLST
jgi:hypothetical protein